MDGGGDRHIVDHVGNAGIIDVKRPHRRPASRAADGGICPRRGDAGRNLSGGDGPSDIDMKSFSWKTALDSPAGRASLALLLVLAAGVIFNADHAFFKIGTHRDTLRQASVYGMLACGMTLVIVSGGIDLAVGSLVALSAVCAAKMAIHWNWPWWEVVPAALAVGVLCGSLAGWVTASLRVQ